MKLFGFELSRVTEKAAVTAVSSLYGDGGVSSRGMWGGILESFSGAWQRNIVADCPENILAFSAVNGCISLISGDIAKLRIKLTSKQSDGTWRELNRGDQVGAAFLPVLTKPNRYQTRIQFLQEWVTSKLIHGNAYGYKDRDNRGVVTAIYMLDPKRVRVLIAPDGSVWYELRRNDLAGLPAEEPYTFPASDIIHDRMNTLWHPLIGVSPIYACGSSATQGARIQNNSAAFFQNMSRPSLHLSAPSAVTDEQVIKFKQQIEPAVSGSNLGRLLVTGGNMKIEPMTIPATDAQLIEQLRWTVEDVCRCFHVPLHKMQSGANPTFNNVGAMNQDYYAQALQIHIESIELLLDEALGLPDLGYGTELDLDGLLRMDPAGRMTSWKDGVGGGFLAPNEARLKENLPPLPGGDSAYLQVQNYSLAALEKRDAMADPFASNAPKGDNTPPPDVAPTPPPPAKDIEAESKAFMERLIGKFAEAEIA